MSSHELFFRRRLTRNTSSPVIIHFSDCNSIVLVKRRKKQAGKRSQLTNCSLHHHQTTQFLSTTPTFAYQTQQFHSQLVAIHSTFLQKPKHWSNTFFFKQKQTNKHTQARTRIRQLKVSVVVLNSNIPKCPGNADDNVVYFCDKRSSIGLYFVCVGTTLDSVCWEFTKTYQFCIVRQQMIVCVRE